MAGDWIKMRHDLADDPAVIGIAAELGIDEFAVIGRLHRFWSWADRQSRDGHAVGVTKTWLDRYIQRDGFADAMVKYGWLEVQNDGITIPKFDRHNGNPAKERVLAAERKRKQRSSKNGHDSVTDMSRSDRDENVTIEKRRVSNKEKLPKRKSVDEVPHEQIIELFHEALPDLPRIREWTDSRKSALRARWEEESKRQNLDWWKRFFEYVAKSNFLCGRDGPESWRADLPWILKRENFIRVIEGTYHRDGTA
jgi:hypothetical protein